MDFDVTPEKGVELKPLPQQAEEKPVEQQAEPVDDAEEVEIEATDEPQQEDAEESQFEETDSTEAQDAEGGLNMSIGQFANAAGVTLKDIYSVTLSDGRTLSQAVDEGNQQKAALAQLQTERNELQEKLQQAQTNVVQGDDPEAMRMELEADLYQKQLDSADFSGMDQGAAANLRLNYMNTIQKLRDQAQVKRAESQGKQQESMYQALEASNREMLSAVPEWVSPEVAGRENKAMGDFLRSRGFSDQDLFTIDRSPKYKLLVRDAWKALAKQAEIKRGAKKVRKISKTLKPGAMKGSSKASLKDVSQKIRQSGTRQEKQKARLSMEFDR